MQMRHINHLLIYDIRSECSRLCVLSLKKQRTTVTEKDRVKLNVLNAASIKIPVAWGSSGDMRDVTLLG